MFHSLRDKLPFAVLLGALAGCTTGGGAAFTGCGGGGLNENQRGPGDQPGGVQVGMGDIAVAPGGEFVLFQRGTELAVGWPATGAVHSLPVTMPTRLAFAKTRPVVYVGSAADGQIHAVDVDERRELWAAPILDASTDAMLIASTADDSRVVVSSWSQVVLLDAGEGGEIEAVDAGDFVIDIEILPDDARALAVPLHSWGDDALPSTRITVLDLAAGGAHTFDVPNCADNIVVAKGGARAFLAPTTCAQDPISYIDLAPGDERFIKNLPGFGPLALGPDGAAAVGFLDMQNVDPTLFDDPLKIPMPGSKDRFYLMVIDTAALTYDFHPVGLNTPRYAMTPDGAVLLLDSDAADSARLFDTATGELRDILGPPLMLDNFVLTRDSAHAYVLQSGLFYLDIGVAASAHIPTAFTPLNINIAPDDHTLYLREDDSSVCVFSIADRRCSARLSAAAPPAL